MTPSLSLSPHPPLDVVTARPDVGEYPEQNENVLVLG